MPNYREHQGIKSYRINKTKKEMNGSRGLNNATYFRFSKLWTHIWPNSYKVGYNPLCPKLEGNPCGRVRGVCIQIYRPFRDSWSECFISNISFNHLMYYYKQCLLILDFGRQTYEATNPFLFKWYCTRNKIYVYEDILDIVGATSRFFFYLWPTTIMVPALS